MRSRQDPSDTGSRRRYDAELAAAYLEQTLNSNVRLPEPPPAPGRVSGLVARLASACGFGYRPVSVNEDFAPLDQMAQALEGCQVRSRQVELTDDWWEWNQPPLVVQDEHGLELVLPGPFSAPFLHREGVEPVKVDESLAATLSRDALQVVLPLAPGALRLRDLVRLSITGLRRDLIMAFAAAVAVGLISLAVPVATDVIFSDVVPTGDLGRLGFIIAALLLLTLATGAFAYTRGLHLVRLEDATEVAVGGGVLDRLLRLPAHELASWPSAQLATRVGVWKALQEAFNYTDVGLISLILVLFNGALLCWFIPSLGAVAVLLGLLLLAAAWLVIRRDNALWHGELAAHSAVDAETIDIIRGWIPVRVSNGEVSALARWSKAYSHYRLAFNSRWTRQVSVEILAVAFLGATTFSFVFIAYELPAGSISGSSFIAFLAAFAQFSAGLVGLLATMRAFEAVRAPVQRLAAVLGSTTEESERSEDPGPLSGALEVRHVGFRYSPDLPWVVKDVSFRAEPGEFIAVVGTSGSGKSTLLRLLLGFEDPLSGIVTYDDRDLTAINRSAVRRQCGVVLQSSLLLSGTIRENITVASGPIPDSRVWQLLELVRLTETIQRMGGGLDTWIDENATIISGGQRQRLLLARALAHKPRYLFLDEATSALDNVTQEALSESIASLDVTRIVIAHRLSTIKQADHIIVLDSGRMVERGNYAELAEANGLFTELISRQEL